MKTSQSPYAADTVSHDVPAGTEFDVDRLRALVDSRLRSELEAEKGGNPYDAKAQSASEQLERLRRPERFLEVCREPLYELGKVENYGSLTTVWTRRTLLRPAPSWSAADDKLSRIQSATSRAPVVSVLESSGFKHIAVRVNLLAGLVKEGAPEMNIESLKFLASTLISHRELPKPGITLTDEGHVHAGWKRHKEISIGLTFLPSGLVDVTAVALPHDASGEIRRIGGLHEPSICIQAVSWFFGRIT